MSRIRLGSKHTPVTLNPTLQPAEACSAAKELTNLIEIVHLNFSLRGLETRYGRICDVIGSLRKRAARQRSLQTLAQKKSVHTDLHTRGALFLMIEVSL